MKQRYMNRWTVTIMAGVLATGLWMLTGCSSVQKNKAGSNRVVEIMEGKNYTIPLSGTVNLEMIWIKPGTFMMGSPGGELGRADEETQHEVTLTRGYWLGKYEVTQSQYEAVMGENPVKADQVDHGDQYPVFGVSWTKALNFCKRLTEQERRVGRLPVGYEYTLPTEAQWEYACRAGTTTALNSGKNLAKAEGVCRNLDKVGWYDQNSKDMCHPAGQKEPNKWGLYDMHGNVWEWCLDWYGDYPATAVTDPVGADTGSYRVLRGGNYGHSASGCRSASRDYYYPSGANAYYGIRLTLTRTSN